MLMPRQFWFLAAGVTSAALAVLWWRLTSAAAAQRRPKVGVARFVGMLFLLCAAPGALIGIFQFHGGHTSPMFFLRWDIGDTTVVGCWAVVALVWVGTLWWLWVGNGARRIADCGRILNLPADEKTVRIIITVCVLGAVTSLLIWSSIGVDRIP